MEFRWVQVEYCKTSSSFEWSLDEYKWTTAKQVVVLVVVSIGEPRQAGLL